MDSLYIHCSVALACPYDAGLAGSVQSRVLKVIVLPSVANPLCLGLAPAIICKEA
jgi:hypothetical protein